MDFNKIQEDTQMDMQPPETEGEDAYGQEAPSDLDMIDPGLMPDSPMAFDPPQ